MQNKKVKKSFALKLTSRVTGDTAQCGLMRGNCPPFSYFASIFCFTKIKFGFLSSFVSLLRKLTECLKMGPVTSGTFPP